MRAICPNCEKETDIDVIRTTEKIKVRGEDIGVEVEYYKCSVCGEEFDDPRSDDDPLDKAYREYRRAHGMVQPEEVRDLRKRYGLTQSEMSKFLGWGAVTLSRYENGALQDEAHEKALSLAMDPQNMLKLIDKTQDALPTEKLNHLKKRLLTLEHETHSLESIYEELFGSYEEDELSGYKRLDLGKFFNAILFFCADGILKTVLNKLLFYAEFKHYKENAISIWGSRYARIPFGPAPDKWRYYFSLLIDEGSLNSHEIFYDEDVTGEKFLSRQKPDLSIFSETELIAIANVKDHFKGWTAKRISDFSHNEKGYIETSNGKFISYRYAEDLQI